MRAERQGRELSDFLGGANSKFRMRVESRSDGGAAYGEIVEAVESDGDAAAIAVEHIDVAGKFLAEGERRGVLQMSATDFYDVGEFRGFGVERIAQSFDGGKQAACGFRSGGDVHGSGKGIVGRL